MVGLWVILAAVVLWAAFAEWRNWSRISVALISFGVFAAFCIATAISIARSAPSARWLGGTGGVLLILYSIAVVTMGSEDVGGPKVAIPIALATAAFGGWTILAVTTQE